MFVTDIATRAIKENHLITITELSDLKDYHRYSIFENLYGAGEEIYHFHMILM